MFTPLLTFQIVACWVADTVGLGDCAWSPPGDLPVPITPSSHLDQPRISSPIVSPLIPARACSYAWQRFSSSTSPTTWGQCGLHNLHNITKSSGHDTGWRKMFTPLLTFQEQREYRQLLPDCQKKLFPELNSQQLQEKLDTALAKVFTFRRLYPDVKKNESGEIIVMCRSPALPGHGSEKFQDTEALRMRNMVARQV
ncbi:hypothetical protein HPB51_008009 [Rhipicephalus microplus]|uniref:Tick transposon n=1 Tax=Rhipicephalus microplus TaxID=6941 RepID=A0A9J6DG08_RHIMP|nr:hypothetical protein HPB51_008009 [Rhipicephalus microplus]